jgi:hypothetical protein
VIYCVVPAELAEAQPGLYDRLVEHYKDDPNVKVIVDRRSNDRRRERDRRGDRRDGEQEAQPRREIRDRRNRRAPGSFPPLRGD